MPVPTVWLVTRRPRKFLIGVAGGWKAAAELAREDARAAATKAGLDPAQLQIWDQHGESPEHRKKFVRASVHVTSRQRESWKQTYDCGLVRVFSLKKDREKTAKAGKTDRRLAESASTPRSVKRPVKPPPPGRRAGTERRRRIAPPPAPAVSNDGASPQQSGPQPSLPLVVAS